MKYKPNPEQEEEAREFVTEFTGLKYTKDGWQNGIVNRDEKWREPTCMLRDFYIAAMLKHGVWKGQV